MIRQSRYLLVSLCLILLIAPSILRGEMRLETLQVGETVYRDVRVKDVSAKWIVILHSGGIAQILIEELSPKMQAGFGYDPERAKAWEEVLVKRSEEVREKRSAARASSAVVHSDGPEPTEEIDLRPRYFDLGLHTKDQGRRPSCAIFAILSVLEFHYSLREEKACFLSEEFLIWATRQINPRRTDANGFSFVEVAAAIDRFGVASGKEMPNTVGGIPMTKIVAGEKTQAEASTRRDVSIQMVIGSNQAKIGAIISELNRGFPVAVALRWPPDGIMARVHTLRDQEPQEGADHAVTIVGYHRPDKNSDELLFLFRNSYGPRWGMGGYGYVSDGYLRKHLHGVMTVRLRD